MKPEFGGNYGWGWELLCPCCGQENLHHEKIEVFERCEDAESGLRVTVTGNIEIDRNLTGNPSCRRHGLKIFFWCENCKAKSVLSVSQHKGKTCVDFDYAEPKGESDGNTGK